MDRSDFDVLIVGGGMVGASLACALDALELNVGLVESVPFSAANQPSYDDRTIALALGSRRIYEALGLWADIAAAAEPIHSIHVSERGRFGTSRMNAVEQGADALGYVVENRTLGRVLGERLEQLSRTRLFCPASFRSLTVGADVVEVKVGVGDREQILCTRLLVGADGANSRVREALGIGVERRDYGQTALVSNVTPEREHGGMAYERFTPDGPIALLPMSERRCALVWTLPSDRVESIKAMPDQAFLAALNKAFGHRLGEFERVGKRVTYPLQRVLALAQHAPRTLLIGNAAHAIHPVAGQGFNLGLRDVAVLTEVLAAHGRDDCGSDVVLARYVESRAADQAHVTQFTDGLVRLFSNRVPGLATFRHLGILGFELLPPVKARFARRSMGMVGAPKLSRGVPLADKARR